MADFITKSELARLRAAIDIEVKNQYIDIKGKTCPFSVFMKGETKKIYQKLGKNPKWEELIRSFEFYTFETYIKRKRIITRYVTLLRRELNPDEDTQNLEKKQTDNDIYTQNVMFLRGVGPKTAALFNNI